MERRISKGTLTLLLVCMLLLFHVFLFPLEVMADVWYPYVPSSSQVSLEYYRRNCTSHINITIEFPDSGCAVFDWGTPVFAGNYSSANSEIWRFDNSFPVITYSHYTYDLGVLSAGEHCFYFTAWWTSVKSLTFTVSPYIFVPDDYQTIQEAINNANEGDTVFVRSGTYYEHVIVNKTISLIGEGKVNTVLNGTTVEPMMIVEANNVRISGFMFEGWAFRNIVINETTGVIIVENKIVFSALGIDVENSVNTTIENNIIDGFGLDNIGIMLAYSSECTIVNNTITNAVYDGIRLWFANNNLIHQNLIRNNDYGIFFHEAGLNTISENTISESGGPGIYIESSSSNKVFHNSFTDNYDQAKIYDNSVNTWDNGFEGNYWSDYTGSDLDHDGIGDSPYVIKENNQDNYPLMNPYIEGDANHDAIVNVKDAAQLAISWLAQQGEGNYNPHVDFDMNGIINVKDAAMIGTNWLKKWEN